MSRAIGFAPLALLLLVVAGLIWRLATPVDTTVPSKMIGKNLADVRVAPALPGRGPCARAGHACRRRCVGPDAPRTRFVEGRRPS